MAARPYKKRLVADDDDSEPEEEAVPAAGRRRAAAVKGKKPAKRRKKDESDEDEDDDDEDDDFEAEEEEDDEEGQVQEEEEGEVAPTRSLPDPVDDYNSADDYDEELFKGPADRTELMAMSNLEREMILAERYDKRQSRQETLQLRAKLREEKEGRKAQSARKPPARGRPQTGNEHAQKLRELAGQRAEKEARRREREEMEEAKEAKRLADRAKEKELFGGSDDDDDEEEEAESKAAVRKSSEPSGREVVDEVLAQPQDLERVRLTRTKMEKWLNEPFFERVLPGCFVRINVGQKDGVPVYRVAEIVAVSEMRDSNNNIKFKEYPLGKTRTSKRLELQIGHTKRFFEMSFCSDRNFDMKELATYTQLQHAAKLRGKSKREIEAKVAELKTCKTYSYSNEEVTQMVEFNKEQGVMKGNLAQRRIELEVKLEAARERNDAAAVAEAQAAVDKLTKKTEISKNIDHDTNKTSFKIQDINQRNAEYQKSLEDKVGSRSLAKEKLMSAGVTKATDPFARLPIRPVSYWTVGKPAEPEAPPEAAPEPPKLEVNVDSAAATEGTPAISPGFKELLATPRDSARADDDDDDAMDAGGEKSAAAGKPPVPTGARAMAHDLDLDLDIEIAPEATAPRPRPRPAVAPAVSAPAGGSAPPSRPTLSVADYKRRIAEANAADGGYA